jgi:hypothetical protein
MIFPEITKITYATLLSTALRLDIKIEIESEFWYILPKNNPKGGWVKKHRDVLAPDDYIDFVPVIEPAQIRQILLAFYYVLGNNPIYEKAERESIPNEENGYDPEYSFACDEDFYVRLTKHKPQKYFSFDHEAYGYISQAESLNNRWLGTLKPMFDVDPVAVLLELNELLKSL